MWLLNCVAEFVGLCGVFKEQFPFLSLDHEAPSALAMEKEAKRYRQLPCRKLCAVLI